MLILSRKPNEKVVFPNLGISVQIIRVTGKAVRLGIDAPPEIRVLREEVASPVEDLENTLIGDSRRFRHELRNRLNIASLGLQLVQRRLELGQASDVEETIAKVLSELQEIDTKLQRPADRSLDENPARIRRALIVEDNANESELLAAYLRTNGYEVDTVDDGLKALFYLKQQRPDVVLLDMCMPRLDGPKTITSIRCEPELQGLKLFAVSGADRKEMGVEVGPRGVNRWFSKPLNANELVRELNRHLEGELLPS